MHTSYYITTTNTTERQRPSTWWVWSHPRKSFTTNVHHYDNDMFNHNWLKSQSKGSTITIMCNIVPTVMYPLSILCPIPIATGDSIHTSQPSHYIGRLQHQVLPPCLPSLQQVELVLAAVQRKSGTFHFYPIVGMVYIVCFGRILIFSEWTVMFSTNM